MEKGENGSYQHFSPVPTTISKPFYFNVIKTQDRMVKR